MNATKKFLPALLVGLLVVMVCPAIAGADEDPLENLNSWYYPYGEDDLNGWYYGWYARGGLTYYEVNGDEGRFREDRFIDNDFTGGFEHLSYSSENLKVSIRAIPEDQFAGDAHYIKPDVFRVDFEFAKHRRYYDGSSNDVWDPTLYGLPSSFNDFDDDNLYADRVDLNLEGTLLIPDIPHVVLGWHHWERFGDEKLLLGGLAQNDPLPRQRSIPTINDLDGESDTVYVEIPVTINDKYNFKFRQEYEDFRDDELSVALSNVVGDTVIHDDSPEWREFRTLFSFDSFLTENIYVSANYYHSDIKNEFERDVFQPGSLTRPFVFIDTDVDNDRTTDVVTLGLVFLNVAKDLTIHTNFRAEHSDTDGDHTGQQTPFGGVLEPVTNATDWEDTRLGESVELVWKGFPNTTVSLEGEWEQRFMDVKEVVEGTFSRDADIDYNNQEYTITVVNRPCPKLRLTARYRFKDNDEDYDEEFDLEPDAYPGILGDLKRDVHEVTLKGDWHFLPAWTTTVKYQFESDERRFDIQNTDGQDLDVHRISATVFGSPTTRITLTGMAMYENYRLDTPTNVPVGNQWAPGTGKYDYRYDSLVFFTSGNYVINDKWATKAAYQHTESGGKDVDNALDEIWLGVEYKLAENKTVSARYEYFDFDDELGDGFEDYHGHGFYVALAYRF